MEKQRAKRAPETEGVWSGGRGIPAEEVGLEPTDHFLDGRSLANCWLTFRRTPPNIINFTSLKKQSQLNLNKFFGKFKEVQMTRVPIA